jgi:hypothetical protein
MNKKEPDFPKDYIPMKCALCKECLGNPLLKGIICIYGGPYHKYVETK